MERVCMPRYKQMTGRPCRFANRDDLLVAIPADPGLGEQFICRRLADQSIQAVVGKSVSSANTVNKVYVGKGVGHTEGGWPKDLNRHDEEQTQRYRKKIEKSAGFSCQVNNLAKTTEHAILQNNAVNIFENYFDNFGPLPIQGLSTARTIGVFKTEGTRRPCTNIAWADGGDFFVCSYISQIGGVNDAHIWDAEYQTVPVYTLKSPKPAPCVEFNPKDIHTLASGLHSGQIAVWDTRTDHEPVQLTDRDCSHRSQVNSLKWSSTKTSSEFFTGSAEGDIFWWDFRKMDQPIDELLLDPNRCSDRRSFGISVLEYEPSMPTKFMAGSEQGVLFSCNKKGKTVAEKIIATVQCHYGPIYSLERNATFLKNYLTVGDWQAKIWTDECKEDAIVWSKSQKHALTSGCWSPTRCSTFFLSRMDGIFEIWDLLLQQNEKVFQLKISDHPILCTRPHKTGRWLSMGTESGDVYHIEVSENLTHSGSSDRAAFLSMLERETKRERLLESKHREMKLKEKESERVRLLHEETAVENAVAEEVLVHHAEAAFLQQLSGEAEPEKTKTLLAYMDAENEEILEGRSVISRKFKF